MVSLQPGTRLGSYEITAQIGAGGMGEVYRARDTKLARDVAIKVLPPLFTRDPERLARFRREAQVLAALNHPHIAQIYGLDQANGVEFLVLELIDGETLADRIARGILPFDEALPIAQQIGDALAAAHDKGIVHRDLKPANIALTADGQVKVLDFGLAKALEPDPASLSPDMSAPPTITSPAMTALGVILGTAAYMAPEQAKGRPADKRSDIWAFGCVLYEMLTGTRAFDGDDVSDTLAGILRGDPEWSALPADAPKSVRLVLRKCLMKDRRQRFADITTPLFLLTELTGDQTEATPPAIASPTARRFRIRAAFAAVAIAASALTAVAAWILWPAPPRALVTRFTIPLADGEQFNNLGRQEVTVSRDGSKIAYMANRHLYVRSISDVAARTVVSVEGASGGGITSPAFSPDGRSIVFWSSENENALERVSLDGGVPLRICASDNPFGLSWAGDFILVGLGAKGIARVSANGGALETLIAVKSGERAYGPQMLPDGDHLLFTLASDPGANEWDTAHLVVQSLRTGTRTDLVAGASDGRYLSNGYLLYATGGVIMAARFDARRLTMLSAPVPVIEGVRRGTPFTSAAHYGVSDTGTLAYISGPVTTNRTDTDIVKSDRDGHAEPIAPAPPPANYEYPRVSPDGRWLVVGSEDEKGADIWICDLTGRTAPRRLTFGGRNRVPVWSADGSRVFFQSDRAGGYSVFSQRADGAGAAEQITHADAGTTHTPQSASPDGTSLLLTVTKGSTAVLDLLSLVDRSVKPFDDVEGTSISATFAPNGTFVAYSALESDGSGGVFVQPFPPMGAKYLIMGGIHPFWSRDGKEVFASRRSGFATVRVATAPAFTFGTLNTLHTPTQERGPSHERNIDVMPDGQHFVEVVQAGSAAPEPQAVDVVLNWFDELKASTGAK